MPADTNIDAHLGGVDPGNGSVLSYQLVRVRARTVWGNLDHQGPFMTGGSPETSATYDAVTGASEQLSWRHIDPYGNVWEPKKLALIQIYWFLDGCPSPLSQERIGQYIELASQLNPWPQGYLGAAAGEPTKAYPAFPPATPVPLDTFLE